MASVRSLDIAGKAVTAWSLWKPTESLTAASYLKLFEMWIAYFRCPTLRQRQNDAVSPLSVPRSLRLAHMSDAKADCLAGGVALIIATADCTGIASDSPFMLRTAISH
jgi:hypothetical protein